MTVGIVGLGLIGGSIGLALREPGRTIIGYDVSPESVKTAKDRFCIDHDAELAEVAMADVVFVAVPPAHVVATLATVASLKGPQSVITDCTSAKAEVNAWSIEAKDPQFVIAHPMAGHEKSGAAYASAWMFRGAKWIVSPQKWTSPAAIKSLEELIKAMGAAPIRMDAEEHDRQIARVSHLPHAMAAVLVLLQNGPRDVDVAGGSWRDLTRVAGVDPDLWSQIFMANRTEISIALTEAQAKLAELQVDLDTGNAPGVRNFFDQARAAKKRSE